MVIGPVRLAAGGRVPDMVIHIPDFMLLRVVARSVLVAVAVIAPPWLRATLLLPSAAPAATFSSWLDEPSCLRLLLADLRHHGLLIPGGSALLLGDDAFTGARVAVLTRDGIVAAAALVWAREVADASVDLVLAPRPFRRSSLRLADRVLKTGAVFAAPLGSDPADTFLLPQNFQFAYIGRFGVTLLEIRKTATAAAAAAEQKRPGDASQMERRALPHRRLGLSHPQSKNAMKPLFLDCNNKGRRTSESSAFA